MSHARRSNLRIVWFIALLGAIACGAATGVRLWPHRKRVGPAPPEPPEIDLAHMAEPDAMVIRALEEARVAVFRAPRSSAAWGRLGMILLAHGAPAPDSNACFTQAEQFDPREPRWFYFHANSLIESDPEAAIQKLARAAELCGDRPDIVRLKLAETLLARGRVADAAAHFQRALHADPGNARATLGLGRIAYLRGDLGEAAERLSAAATDSRTHKAASALLAEVQHRAGEHEKAERLLSAANESADDPPWFDPFTAEVDRMQIGRKRNLGMATALLRTHQIKEAIELLRETLRQYPGSMRVLLLLGLAHNMDNNWTEGEKTLRAALSISPDAPRVHYQLGLNLAAQHRYADAAVCFDTAARLMPNDAMASFHLGRCLSDVGNFAAAEQALRVALDTRPAFPEAERQLADLLVKSGRREEARRHIQHALSLNPRDVAAERLRNDIEAER